MFIPVGRPDAIAVISGDQMSSIYGSVKFYRMGKGTLVVADIGGLPETKSGFFGFHIHKGGNCAGVIFLIQGATITLIQNLILLIRAIFRLYCMLMAALF